MKHVDTVLKSATILVSVMIVILGAHTVITEPVTQWSGTSLTIALTLLVVTSIIAWRKRSSFFSQTALLYSSVLVGRLFGTLRLDNASSVEGLNIDPLLIGETGSGITSITYLSYGLVMLISIQLFRLAYVSIYDVQSTRLNLSINDWAMTFIRVYVGLMFIAHYSGHLLAGPVPFQVFVEYFAGVGFHIGAPMVVLAGVIEIAVSIGLVFGLMTRTAAIGAAVYLFFATLWGAHFSVGYIWVLPNGGWEFSALWIAVILAFALAGGGQLSVDHLVRRVACR